MQTRSIDRQPDGTPLARAAAGEQTFSFENVIGTLVGFWSPRYASTLTVPGYHLHFLSNDRRMGGHVLDCRGDGLVAQVQHEADLRVSLPESPGFLRADLTRDGRAEFAQAERAQD
jgi:acetolactate decarboxylase